MDKFVAKYMKTKAMLANNLVPTKAKVLRCINEAAENGEFSVSIEDVLDAVPWLKSMGFDVFTYDDNFIQVTWA